MPSSDTPLLEPGWRESVRSVNGVDLHVVEAGAEGAPLLVLLHGFPEFWWAWRHQITPLAEAGHHVVVPDLRGYATSSAPQQLDAYRLDVLARDVLGLADELGAERIDLVGHDWGGVLAWEFAARHPERLHRLVVLAGPHPDTLLRQILRHPTQGLRSAYAGFFQLPWLPETALRAFGFAALRASMQRSARAGTFEPGALDRYAAAWSQPGSLTAMLNYYRAVRLRRPGSSPSRHAHPTLVLWGEHDDFLEQHVARQSLTRCDDGRLVVIEDAGHWLHLEQPDLVTAEILSFLGAPGD
ncbi:alpha/beta fold hydrolase [Knoellia sp. Soil729]|uniref:alpha/beta fold hydrolase n=1 Tax=Knoellia sp. Soil729 TaxID=1736394 RepID=UPI00070209C6|nr:alpha/beta fold hydrolase [Knoellia sp. Soil729]KRE40433.1 alpha/beta hydrolase [Knoellia sp. Soil729]